MVVLAHMGGIPELLTFLAPVAAFGIGGYFLVYRPLKEDNTEPVTDETEYSE